MHIIRPNSLFFLNVRQSLAEFGFEINQKIPIMRFMNIILLQTQLSLQEIDQLLKEFPQYLFSPSQKPLIRI